MPSQDSFWAKDKYTNRHVVRILIVDTQKSQNQNE